MTNSENRRIDVREAVIPNLSIEIPNKPWTPYDEERAQRMRQWTARYSAIDQDVMVHLQNIRKSFQISDSSGRMFSKVRPWEWIETDWAGRARGANRRKQTAVHEAGHCVAAFLLGDYPTKARVNKSRNAATPGYLDSMTWIHCLSAETVQRSVRTAGLSKDHAILAASFQVIGFCSGVQAARFVGGLPQASDGGFNDDCFVRNLYDAYPCLDLSDLRSLASALVSFYSEGIKTLAMELYEETELETRNLLRAVERGFGPDFPVHPRVTYGLKHGPHCAIPH